MRNPFTKDFTKKIGFVLFLAACFAVIMWMTILYQAVPV